MAKRKTITKQTRFEVFKRDSFKCVYCGEAAPRVVLHIDHIQPVSKGGTNDLINLVTSCFECNMGKSNRLLSDDSAVQKQKSQLDDLQERREQLEMMMQWREGLSDLGDQEIEIAKKEWRRITETYYLSDNGVASLKKLVKKFGLQPVLDSMQKAATYLEFDASEGRFSQESVEHAFSKVGGICKLESLPEWQRDLHHVRNIARSRAGGWWHHSTSAHVLSVLEEAYNVGYTIDQLKRLASEGLSYTELIKELEKAIQNAQ